jgi:KaiC/GvpD/RAD55 family RecA-like ATPase
MAFVNGLEMVPDNSVLCIEEKSANIKSIYALYVASERAREGIPVKYLTLQSQEDIRKTMARLKIPLSDLIRVIELPPDNARHDVLALIQDPGARLVIIDPFSVFFAEDSFSEVTSLLSGLMIASRKGTTFLLLMDTGILAERQEYLVRAMADGVIQFVVLPEGDKLRNYISIPKMRGEFPQDKMLPFTISSEGLLIDTRERHG